MLHGLLALTCQSW